MLSRYDGVAEYDWIAIPLVPYLYAVERPEDVPLFADAKMVAFLGIAIAGDIWRTSFRICPTEKHLEGTGTNSSAHPYDRITYAFEIETSPEQDQALIRKFINLYQPKALRRSYLADLGISTPKQMAKRMVQFSDSHPELRLSRFIIPQVPGDIARSKAVHGVVESFLKSKKYIVPSGVASPIFAGCVAARLFRYRRRTSRSGLQCDDISPR